MSKFWAKVKIMKRRARSTFGNRSRMDGKEEYIIKIPGWSGELRKYMTEDEALELMEDSNMEAFREAAEASKGGLYGYERFTKYGYGKDAGSMLGLVGRMASRGFADKRREKKE